MYNVSNYIALLNHLKMTFLIIKKIVASSIGHFFLNYCLDAFSVNSRTGWDLMPINMACPQKAAVEKETAVWHLLTISSMHQQIPLSPSSFHEIFLSSLGIFEGSCTWAQNREKMIYVREGCLLWKWNLLLGKLL